MPQKIASHEGQFSLFIAVHGGLSRLEVALGTGLDLDKTQDIPLPSDQIQFAAVIGRAKISSNNRITPPAKKKVGIFFSTAAGAVALGDVLRSQRSARKPVQRA